MEEITNEIISPQPKTTFRLKASLVPIDQYADREGVSIRCIERCAQLGMFHLRKYKGRTFVVDVPPDPYISDADISEDIAELPCGMRQLQTPEPQQKLSKKASSDEIDSSESNGRPAKAGTLSKIIKKLLKKAYSLEQDNCEILDDRIEQCENTPLTTPDIQTQKPDPDLFPDESVDEQELDRIISETLHLDFPETCKTVDEPAEYPDDDEIKLVEEPSEPFTVPEKGIFEIDDEDLEFDYKPTEIEEKGGFDPFEDLESFRQRSLSMQYEAKRSRQLTAAFLTTFLLTVIFAVFWFSFDIPASVNGYGLSSQSVQNNYDMMVQSESFPEAAQDQPQTDSAQPSQTGSELEDSIARVKSLRNELNLAVQDYETLAEQNSRATERLDEEIQRLVSQPGGLE